MKLENIDINEVKNLDNFSGIVPLFPLSTVVFFPNTLLPLHIFEQRYREMLSDAQNSEKIIAMALLKPGWEKTPNIEDPEIFNVAGMGRIVNSETLSNGRSNIVLYGLKRVKIIEEIEDKKPYRNAKIEILNNQPESYLKTDPLREHIGYLVSSWNKSVGKNNKHRIQINLDLPLGSLTDVMTSVLIADIFKRQKMLEETDVEKRAEKIISFLETRLKIFSITSKRKSYIKRTRNLN